VAQEESRRARDRSPERKASEGERAEGRYRGRDSIALRKRRASQRLMSRIRAVPRRSETSRRCETRRCSLVVDRGSRRGRPASATHHSTRASPNSEGGGAPGPSSNQRTNQHVVHKFCRALECRTCESPTKSADAAVLVQQTRRRLSDVPWLGNIIEIDMDSGRADATKSICAGRHRALEQAALPGPARGTEARGQEGERFRSKVHGTATDEEKSASSRRRDDE